jgi:uncharacterized protein
MIIFLVEIIMKKKIPDRIKSIIKEANDEFKNIYSGRLKKVILYGSYARGDFSAESDIDLAILLNDMQNINTERKKYLPVIASLSLKYDTLISAVPFNYKDFSKYRTPLSLNINREGIVI